MCELTCRILMTEGSQRLGDPDAVRCTSLHGEEVYGETACSSPASWILQYEVPTGEGRTFTFFVCDRHYHDFFTKGNLKCPPHHERYTVVFPGDPTPQL